MKKSLGLLVTLLMLLTLSGCSGSSSSTSSPSEKASPSVQPSNTSTAKPNVVTIKYVIPGTQPKSYQEVIDAVNKKLLDDGVGVQIEEQFIDWSVWNQKLNLMLSTGEDFDMFQVMNDQVSLSNYIARGAAQDIGKALDQYGANIKKVIPQDVFNAVSKDGKIYGIPAYWYESAQDGGFTTNNYLFKKYGISTQFNTVQDLLDASVKLYNAAPNPKPIFPVNFTSTSSDVLNRSFDSYPFDVRDGVAMITKDGKVNSWIESNEFKQESDIMHQMYQKKLLNPDLLTMKSDQGQKAVKEGNWPFMFGTYGNAITDIQKTFPDIQKTDLTYQRFNPEKGYYRFVNAKNLNVIASNSKHPAEAVKFINWLYANQDNYDLFMYGIEGKTYKKVGDHQMEPMVDPATQNWLTPNSDWMIGNLHFIRTSSEALPSALTIYNQVPDAKSFISSGFFFDSSPVKTEFANVKATLASDVIPIFSGVLDYNTHIKQAVDKLKAAGLDKVIAEYQKQLNAYMATNK
ncbi:MAG: hypothetical protein A2189_07980 [Paenibacillus sp. RIFOXYA1_FULL_44_5]|nr:MAG: hypothetical protein A2189_07980 [Paenibacillus sp. RIFOXYA1_FULL_44_5]